MLLYYRSFEDFNDCTLQLVKNYNKYKVTPTKGYEDVANKQMQYRDAVQVLTVHAYNNAVKFFTLSRVHKQHLTALGLSFLEATYFFGGKFRDESFTGPNKPRHKHYRKLVRTNGSGRQTAMEELLTIKEGIAGCFYMDVDTLSTLYKDKSGPVAIHGRVPPGRKAHKNQGLEQSL